MIETLLSLGIFGILLYIAAELAKHDRIPEQVENISERTVVINEISHDIVEELKDIKKLLNRED